MPSRDGLLNHLHDPSHAHLMRIRIIVRTLSAENDDAAEYLQSLPFSALAKLHGEFHRLDADDARQVDAGSAAGVESVVATLRREGR